MKGLQIIQSSIYSLCLLVFDLLVKIIGSNLGSVSLNECNYWQAISVKCASGNMNSSSSQWPAMAPRWQLYFCIVSHCGMKRDDKVATAPLSATTPAN